jgi:hypothetical protein
MQVTASEVPVSNAALARPAGPSAVSGVTLTSPVILTLWLALVSVLGARGAFITAPGQPPIVLFAGVILPVIAFLAGYQLSDRFRDRVLAADLRVIAGIQSWRFLGFGLVALYANGVLPGVFALPAGIGDMAVAAAAPWIAASLARRSDFATSRTFAAWNWLGIIDLVMAVSAGAAASGLVRGLVGTVTTAPMAKLPLVLIPAYLVPIMLMLHLTMLLQSHRLATNRRS